MRRLVVAALLWSGCAHYLVPESSMRALESVPPEDRVEVSIPALRVEDDHCVWLRGSTVRKDDGAPRPGYVAARAWGHSLTAGIVVMSLGGAITAGGAGLLGYGASRANQPACALCTTEAIAGTALMTALGTLAAVTGTVVTLVSIFARPQEHAAQLRHLDGSCPAPPGPPPLAPQ